MTRYLQQESGRLVQVWRRRKRTRATNEILSGGDQKGKVSLRLKYSSEALTHSLS